VLDSDQRWLEQRSLASRLGRDALVLIGASRMQLGLDMETAQALTGLTPVMLALDGSSFVPVLEGLAADERITGTILVDYYDAALARSPVEDAASRLQRLWLAQSDRPWWPGTAATDAWLFEPWQSRLRSYADGARPMRSLLLRTWGEHASLQYLQTLSDRSRRADYARLDIHGFYLDRVSRHLGSLDRSAPHLDSQARFLDLQSRVATLSAEDDSEFMRSLDRVMAWVRRIEQRGGRVLFVQFPTSGLIREIDQRRFPRQLFWNRLQARMGAAALHVQDHSDLARFECPDGSHLDQRDRVGFTTALLQRLQPQLGKSLRHD
jgi:hypothetical protein